jgi:hypothetical protein
VDLGSISRETLVLVAAGALAIAILQAFYGWSRTWARRRTLAIRMDRAARGEVRAARWLEDRGYVIRGAQVVAEHAVRVDDRLVTVSLRADYLVVRSGARYVVEVKTGALAPRIETSATRRQMLEYRVAFDVDGILLVNGETGVIHEVTFPALAPRAVRRPWGVLALAAVLVIVAVRLAV